MKVSDLIALLQDFDSDAEVHMAYPAGDYWRNTLAPTVRAVGDGCVRHSTYHGDFVLVEQDEDDDDSPRTQPVVVLGF